MCRMLEVKEHLTTLLEELEWEKLKRSSMEVLIIERNITCPSDECDQC